jgi:hypothetical protein
MTIWNSSHFTTPSRNFYYFIYLFTCAAFATLCFSVVVDYTQAHSARTLYSRAPVALSSKSNVLRGMELTGCIQ